MVKYGLLGHPLGHSFSRKFHNERFERLGIDAVYENFDLESLETLPSVIQSQPDLRGLNVTIPYKQAVMPFLDDIHEKAARIGAVNTIKIEHVASEVSTKLPGLRLVGYNSDVVGFADSINPLLDLTVHKKALILGTGGASKAVKFALEERGMVTTYVSRRKAPGQLTYEDLTPAVMADYKVIVNCSPVGMFPHVDEAPAIPYECLTSQHVCFDLIYNPAVTQFMARAAQQGAVIKGGLEMLEGQALESYRIWTEG